MSRTRWLFTAVACLCETLRLAAAADPVITNATSATARVGQPFKFAVLTQGTNSTMAVAAGGRTPGISFRRITNTLFGTPTTDGSFDVRLLIRSAPPLDDAILYLATLNVTLVSDPAVPVMTSAATARLMPGQLCTYTITAPNEPVSKTR